MAKDKTPTPFDTFWSIYPRKADKKKARKRWPVAIAAIVDAQEISEEGAVKYLLERVRLFSKSATAKSKEFCPYPSTWLYNERFDDDIDEWKTSDKKNGEVEYEIRRLKPGETLTW